MNGVSRLGRNPGQWEQIQGKPERMSGKIATKLKTFAIDENGATAIEYGLIGATFGIVLIALMPVFSPAIKGVYQHILDSVLTVANNWS